MCPQHRRATIDIDLGDIVLTVRATVKGLQPPTFTWRIGAPQDTTAAERAPRTTPPVTQSRKADAIVELHADKKTTVSIQATDEIGNPTTFDGTITYSVDDPSLINLTDNGDGTAVAAATGTLGAALLTVDAVRTADGKAFSGALALNVIAGDVEAITVTAGPEEEVTPDA